MTQKRVFACQDLQPNLVCKIAFLTSASLGRRQGRCEDAIQKVPCVKSTRGAQGTSGERGDNDDCRETKDHSIAKLIIITLHEAIEACPLSFVQSGGYLRLGSTGALSAGRARLQQQPAVIEYTTTSPLPQRSAGEALARQTIEQVVLFSLERLGDC